MSLIEFTKKTLMNYFIIVTGITIAIAVLGLNYDPGTKMGYEAFFSPIILAAVATLPSYVLYSRKELTLKQMLIRRVLHLITLEILLLALGYTAGFLKGFEVTIMFMLSILVVYAFKMTVNWMVDSKTAVEINQGLKKLQS